MGSGQDESESDSFWTSIKCTTFLVCLVYTSRISVPVSLPGRGGGAVVQAGPDPRVKDAFTSLVFDTAHQKVNSRVAAPNGSSLASVVSTTTTLTTDTITTNTTTTTINNINTISIHNKHNTTTTIITTTAPTTTTTTTLTHDISVLEFPK
ncbi:hypothetical protein E2C01_000135 [Portunus trituberculatus]|uniref:Uncharacterized protein n=1 Tax=Portunus trituberculatus TaxID=210409 RepID=A0A5B7CFQ3_PORTR|nr:hypothetical protein [Portunus trituberculatus]